MRNMKHEKLCFEFCLHLIETQTENREKYEMQEGMLQSSGLMTRLLSDQINIKIDIEQLNETLGFFHCLEHSVTHALTRLHSHCSLA